MRLLDKVRDKHGNIVGYILEGVPGRMQSVDRAQVKKFLLEGGTVLGLKLSADGRVIDDKNWQRVNKTEKQKLTGQSDTANGGTAETPEYAYGYEITKFSLCGAIKLTMRRNPQPTWSRNSLVFNKVSTRTIDETRKNKEGKYTVSVITDHIIVIDSGRDVKVLSDKPLILDTCDDLLSDFKEIKNIGIRSLDVSKVSSFVRMFDGCYGVRCIQFANFNTKSAVNMARMFAGCTHLEQVNVECLRTSKVINMAEMFDRCESLESLDLRNFNTSQVRNMEGMFCGCHSLQGIDLRSFDTSLVSSMCYMFSGCREMSYVELGSFNTEHVLEMEGMFNACSELRELNLNSFRTPYVHNIDDMFFGCTKLEVIYAGNFTLDSVDGVACTFMDCPNFKRIESKDAERWRRAIAIGRQRYAGRLSQFIPGIDKA